MRVLVTGAAGLLGRAVVPQLEAKGFSVWGCDRAESYRQDAADLSQPQDVERVFRVTKPDAVVHLAGRRASVAQQHALAADLLLDNLAIDVNVFRAMRAHGVKRGVYASTVSVYRSFAGHRFCEEDVESLLPDDSVRFSAFGKLTAERAIEAMNLQDGAQISVVRLVNTYGPHDNFGPDALVIPALIRRALSGEKPLGVHSAGAQRDVLYVDDAARGIAAALEAEKSGTWNIGTGAGVSVVEIAATVMLAAGRNPLEIECRDGGPSGAMRKVVDPSKAKHELGWEPTVPLADGIRRTVEWYRNNYKATA